MLEGTVEHYSFGDYESQESLLPAVDRAMEDARVYNWAECLAKSIGYCRLITKYPSRMALVLYFLDLSWR